jgi:hypothetical protein
MIRELDTVVLADDLPEYGLNVAISGPWSWSIPRVAVTKWNSWRSMERR